MIPRFLQVNGHTTGQRHVILEQVKAAISSSGGYILDFHRFSNTAICLNIELPIGQIPAFYTALQATDVRLEAQSHEHFAAASKDVYQLGAEAHGREIAGTVQITFLHTDPDLIIEVPMIPG